MRCVRKDLLRPEDQVFGECRVAPETPNGLNGVACAQNVDFVGLVPEAEGAREPLARALGNLSKLLIESMVVLEGDAKP